MPADTADSALTRTVCDQQVEKHTDRSKPVTNHKKLTPQFDSRSDEGGTNKG